MKDLIERQAAIRWVKTECNPYGKPTLDFESGIRVIEHLEQMPSAQPDTPDTNGGDIIYRQAAIDELDKGAWGAEWDKALAQAMIESLPSAQPEDCDTCKHGYFGDSHCDNCRVRYPSHYERRTE